MLILIDYIVVCYSKFSFLKQALIQCQSACRNNEKVIEFTCLRTYTSESASYELNIKQV